MFANPYTPGAGFMPAYLAGREKQIEQAERCLQSIQKRYPQRSVIYYGLRGVGKTVLLNTIENTADNLGILYGHIEAGENSRFTDDLMVVLNRIAHEVSFKEAAKDFAHKCLALIKAFAVTYNVEEGTFGVGMNQAPGFVSGVYANDLTEIMTQIGKAAQKSEDTICIFIDEVQYLTQEEIAGLIIALHRCNQLRLPIMIFCAGLPKILQVVGEACSYSERLFQFDIIGALPPDESEAAIRFPAKDFDVDYSNDAVREIIKVTAGYPYFIQEMCSSVWIDVEEKDVITIENVVAAENRFWEMLDKGFFSVRYNRCTPREKSFMTAMVKCGALPCSISNVAKIMGSKVSSISLIRAQLISKGMIYPTGHAEIDFTVPQFDSFIKRVNPELNF